ncbi:MAG TPA: GNAT family N-acetyltransferase [Luteolibacter sp.]|nr:GNAT family N-acetyltransferase [Luteolibacter sp.]
MKPLTPELWPLLIRPGSRVFIGGGASVPFGLVDSMLASAHLLKDVELVHIHGLGPSPWIDARYNDVLRTNSLFLSPAIREAVERGQADYTPCPMSEVAQLFRDGPLRLDVALIQVSPPDSKGNCSLGLSVDIVKSAVQNAHVVIAQINPKMPRTHGDTRIALRDIDYALEKSSPLQETAKAELTERHKLIGQYAAQLIEDGSTIQIGLGHSPKAVALALHKHRHLGIHSGMFNNALMELVNCGAVDNSRKSFKPGKIIASHVMGSRKLYRFVDDNPALELHASEWVNDPVNIARNHRMVAVNGAREIDLTGQVVRDSSGHRFYGGIGALQDFIRGAGRSKGGRPIIALTSTSDTDGRSRIVANLQSGSGVATARSDVHYVVTEYGIADLHGRSIRERVARLVEIAHPDHRESLLAGAHSRGWLPKYFTMPATGSHVAGKGLESSWIRFGKQTLLLRPLHPSDMRALQEFFYSHDEDTIRLRYGYQRDRMSGESAYKLAAVDQRRDLALGLFEDLKGQQVLRAVGRYYLDQDSSRAEVAFVVHEKCRHSGIAGFLLGELATVAKRRAVTTFWASVLAENRAMSALFLAAGGRETEGADNGECSYEIPVAAILRSRKAFLKRKQISHLDHR